MSNAAINNLKWIIEGTPPYREIAAAVRQGQQVCVEGISGGGKSFFMAALLADARQSALVLTFNDERATQLASDLRALLQGGVSGQRPDGDPGGGAGRAAAAGSLPPAATPRPGETRRRGDGNRSRRVLVYPSVASALYDGVTPERATVAERLTVLERLCAGEPVIVVASIRAITTLTVPSADLVAARREVAVGDEIDRDDLARAVYNLGYQSVDLVDDVGQFSVRGGIVDVSPPTSPLPARIELFGDEVETIRHFDPLTQRSVDTIQRIGLGPAGEILLTERAVNRALPIIKGAYRRELDRLNEEGKQREASVLKERLSEDLALLEQLRPMPRLVHYLPYIYPEPRKPVLIPAA